MRKATENTTATTISAVANIIVEFGVKEPQRIRENNENEYVMNMSQFDRFRDLLATAYEDTIDLKQNSDDENLYKMSNKEGVSELIRVIPQTHDITDKDTKVFSERIGEVSYKMIYHRDKNGKKEYRFFKAEKVNGKLKRTRIINDDIKRIHNNKDKMIAYYNEKIKGKVEAKAV